MFDRILNRPLQCEEKCGIDLFVAFAVRKNGRRTVLTYLTFTCSKSTIKTLEKDKKYVQS